MKKLYFILLTITFVLTYNSCKKDDDDADLIGNWTERSDLDGVARNSAVSFCIGKDGYLGLGYTGKKYLLDFWKYDSDKNSWSQIDSFPGAGRTAAVGFSVNGKGYVCTGYDGENYLKDTWEYDPETNTWTQKADFAGTARYGALSFAIGSKGYVGTGYDDNYLKDFWSYDPSADSWAQVTSISGSKRRNAVSFVINNMAYVCTGLDNGEYLNDFWRYDPSADTWSELRKIANKSSEGYDDAYSTIVRTRGVAFANDSKGYVTLGMYTNLLKETWEYDPSTDLWTQKTGFEGATRVDAVSFSLNNRLFITTGTSGSYQFDDLWEFKPDETYDENN
jgi:N-acetylneuraminic acid mutarotase